MLIRLLELGAALFQFRFREAGLGAQRRHALGLALARLRHRLQFGALDGVECRHFVVLGREFARLAAAAARHLDLRQQVAGGVDRGQGGGVGGLADRAAGGLDHGRRFGDHFLAGGELGALAHDDGLGNSFVGRVGRGSIDCGQARSLFDNRHFGRRFRFHEIGGRRFRNSQRGGALARCLGGGQGQGLGFGRH
jgi:hypothetical protein